MNRRSFLKLLGVAPLLGLAARMPCTELMPSTTGPLRELAESPYVLGSEKPYDVIQTLEVMPTMCHAWLLTTTFNHGGKFYMRQTLWDDKPDQRAMKMQRRNPFTFGTKWA
jgi:hypothetical protein